MADNTKNLIPQAHKLTVEEQSAGGKRSAEVRREKRDLKRAFDALLEKAYTDAKGVKKTGAELLAMKQFESALKGDPRAFEIVRDTSGQKPIERVMIADVDQSVIDEVERAVLEDDPATSD